MIPLNVQCAGQMMVLMMMMMMMMMMTSIFIAHDSTDVKAQSDGGDLSVELILGSVSPCNASCIRITPFRS